MVGGQAQTQTVGGGGAPHVFSPLCLLFPPSAPSREGGIRCSWGVGGTETGHQDLAACRRPSGGSGVTPALASPGQAGLEEQTAPACCPGAEGSEGQPHECPESRRLERCGPVSTAARG